VIDTPIGALTIAANQRVVTHVKFGRYPAIVDNAEEYQPGTNAVLEQAENQLQEYFRGERTQFDLPLDQSQGTEFQKRAWEQLQRIPYGEVITYGEQAARLGNSKAARAVGSANNKNPIAIVVPCHRVVGAQGALVGFAAGVDIKQRLLQHEQAVLRRINKKGLIGSGKHDSPQDETKTLRTSDTTMVCSTDSAQEPCNATQDRSEKPRFPSKWLAHAGFSGESETFSTK